jgi:hypothetical protein
VVCGLERVVVGVVLRVVVVGTAVEVRLVVDVMIEGPDRVLDGPADVVVILSVIVALLEVP